MSDFIHDGECVTHHYACDCREERFRIMEKNNAALMKVLEAFDKLSDAVRWSWDGQRAHYTLEQKSGERNLLEKCRDVASAYRALEGK